jgi:dephospho-CoA kinase
MLRVGLTGGIGSGKSTVAGRLGEHGAMVIDSDRLAREVVEPGTPGLAEIVAAFGEEMLTGDGALDRGRLAAVVFTDETARARLNAIVHPLVGARTAELMGEVPPDGIVVHDVPLLVENGLAPNYHLVVVVDAPVEVRVHRLVTERGMSEEDARARISSQAGDEARRAAADVWLDNSASRDEILAAVDTLWADRLVRYASNIRLHRGAGTGPPRIVDYDPTWPAQAARLIARVRRAAGDLRVDHIGSTAVPGLAGKDVIDLQVTVSTLDDAAAIVEPLNRAGFVHRPEIGLDQAHGDDPGDDHGGDPERWRKSYHKGADPGRPVNLHVRAEGGPGWRFALLFVDWLRADESVRDEYLAVKRDLAARFATDDTTANYADAKEPWFTAAYPRMVRWAELTGWTP